MRRLLLIIALLFTYTLASAQSTFRLNNTSSWIKIKGTSSIHEWEMAAEEFSGKADFLLVGNKIERADNVFLEVVVNSLESGKSIMDKKTMNALRQEDFPTISFESTSTTCSTGHIDFVGNLKIVGNSQVVKSKVNYDLSQGVPHISGSVTLLMSGFGIEPPVALMGTLKTGDQVTIEFDLIYELNPNILNK